MRLSKKATVEWMLKRGDNALDVAKLFLNMRKRQYSAICFHSKWAAEEFLLVYLFTRGEKLDKINIVNVLRRCKKHDKTFSEIEPVALFLKPFDDKVLYPGGAIANVRDARRAIRSAESVRSFVWRKIEKQS